MAPPHIHPLRLLERFNNMTHNYINMKKDIPFEKIFEKEFVDIPSSIPTIKYPLKRAGIKNRPHYLTVLDPFTNKKTNLLAEIKVVFNLPETQRGLHMSRIELALHSLKSRKILPLKDYSIELCRHLVETQKQEFCEVEITAFYEKDVSKNVSKRPGHELMKLHVITSIEKNKTNIKTGVTVPIINACPCTQRWGMKDFYESLKNRNLKEEEIKEIVKKAPLQAHTNRGDVSLFADSNEATFQNLYNVIENSSPIARELLSSEDEHSVVKESHERALFCEDVAREVIFNLIKGFKDKFKAETNIEIIVDIDESIHFHNLHTEIKDSFGNIKRNLK